MAVSVNRGPVVGVLIVVNALHLEVYIRAPDFLEAPVQGLV